MSTALTFLAEFLVAALLLVGGAFVLIGAYGLLKLPDLMTRLHAPTKAATLGVGALLAASILFFTAIEGRLTLHQLLVAAFILITAPVSALMIAKAHIWRHRGATEQPLPPSGGGTGWATLGAPSAPDARAPSPPDPAG